MPFNWTFALSKSRPLTTTNVTEETPNALALSNQRSQSNSSQDTDEPLDSLAILNEPNQVKPCQETPYRRLDRSYEEEHAMHVVNLLAQNSLNTDLVLKCQGQEFHVHQMLFCGLSPIFRNALHDQPDRAQTHTVHLFDIEPRLLGLFVSFMYHGAYTPALHRGGGPTWETLLDHVGVRALCVRFQVPHLAQAAGEMLCDDLEAVCERWAQDAGGLARVVDALYASTAEHVDVRARFVDEVLVNLSSFVLGRRVYARGFLKALRQNDGFKEDVFWAALDWVPRPDPVVD